MICDWSWLKKPSFVKTFQIKPTERKLKLNDTWFCQINSLINKLFFNFRMSSRNKGTGKRSSQNQTSNGHEEKRFKNGHDQNGHSQNTSSSVQFKFSQILKNQEENLRFRFCILSFVLILLDFLPLSDRNWTKNDKSKAEQF